MLTTIVTLASMWAVAGNPIAARHPDAVELFACSFEQADDQDFDGWPDGWSRQRGRGFPHYVTIRAHEEPSPHGERSLRIGLDGGAAIAYSPPIPIDPRQDCLLECFVKTERLKHDEAFFTLSILDEKHKVLHTFTSDRRRGDGDWAPLRLGPISPGWQDARFARIGLHLQPSGPDYADLEGSAIFDDVWFGQSPRMTLEAIPPQLFYTVGDPIAVECRISGRRSRLVVQLEMQDATGQTLLRLDLPLKLSKPPRSSAAANDNTAGPAAVLASARWQPPINQPGFYRVVARLPGEGGLVHVRELTLAVIEPPPQQRQGEFGWSLPDGEGPLPLADLAGVLSQAGISWLKFPLWYNDQDEQRVAELTWFADRLNSHGIGLVGLLNDPPPETRRALGVSQSTAAANIFAQNPDLWYPSLEPVMARMSLKVRWWQLGRDDDTSFAGLSDPAGTLTQVKQQLDRIGQNVPLGVGWSWLDDEPPTANPPWRFLSRSASPALSADELSAYLDRAADGRNNSWVVLEGLDPASYSVTARAADLVRRMVAAKEHGAKAIFFSASLTGGRALVSAEGKATELLLPWRTAALALAGATYEGQLDLPGGSENRVFSRDGQMILVAFSNTPRQEVLYLGAQARQTDIWGRTTEPARTPRGQVINVEPLPSFVTGIDEAVCRWRMTLALNRDRLPSVFGAPHQVGFRFKNHFSQSVAVRVRVLPPDSWKAVPDTFDFKMGAGEEMHQSFELTFPLTASCGRNRIGFEFQVDADQTYRFDVHRPIELGLGDLLMEFASHVNAQGELEVEQRLVNRTDREASFRCHLSAPNRRRMRKQVLRLRLGEDVQSYRLPDGAKLVGQTLNIRAEEIGGGNRILNYTFTAEP